MQTRPDDPICHRSSHVMPLCQRGVSKCEQVAQQRTDRLLRWTGVFLSGTRITWSERCLWCQPTNWGTRTLPFSSLQINTACEVVTVCCPNVCVWRLRSLGVPQSPSCFVTGPVSQRSLKVDFAAKCFHEMHARCAGQWQWHACAVAPPTIIDQQHGAFWMEISCYWHLSCSWNESSSPKNFFSHFARLCDEHI